MNHTLSPFWLFNTSQTVPALRSGFFLPFEGMFERQPPDILPAVLCHWAVIRGLSNFLPGGQAWLFSKAVCSLSTLARVWQTTDTHNMLAESSYAAAAGLVLLKCCLG